MSQQAVLRAGLAAALMWAAGAFAQFPIPPVSQGGHATIRPNAEFTASTTFGFSPLTVHFRDLSGEAWLLPTKSHVHAWLWNFGDGAVSTKKHPKHTYRNTGPYTKYTVTLTVFTNLGNDTKTRREYITVTTLRPPQELLPELPPSYSFSAMNVFYTGWNVLPRPTDDKTTSTNLFWPVLPERPVAAAPDGAAEARNGEDPTPGRYDQSSSDDGGITPDPGRRGVLGSRGSIRDRLR